MNLLRFLLWATVMGAAALSGPNIPAQLLVVLREVVNFVCRNLRLNRPT